MSPTTASTATSRRDAATRWPCTSRASPATAAPSPTPNSSARSPRPPMPSWTSASPRATGWSSTCPVIPETVIITLAVARIGAIHSLVFGGFSAEALKFRVEDTGAKLLVTTDGQFRRGVAVPVKDNADAAVAGDNAIEHVLVVNRTTPADALDTVPMTEGRDVWWHDAVGQRLRTSTRPRRSTPRRRCSSCTPPAPPASPRAWSTPPAATSPRRPGASSTCSATRTRRCGTRTCTGARPTSPGSPRTPTRSTARSPTAPPR